MNSGMVRVRGAEINSPTPAAMTKRGVCYFPSDRVAEGLALARPVRENVSMSALDLPGFSRHRILQRRSERRIRAGDRRETVAAPAAHRTRLRRFPAAIGRKSCWRAGRRATLRCTFSTSPPWGLTWERRSKFTTGGDGGRNRSGFFQPAGGSPTSRIGSMSCIDPAWRPSSPAPTSANRRCCRISSASNKAPVLPRTPWQRTTPRRTRSIDRNGNERQIDQR